jgi:hypothetical protein
MNGNELFSKASEAAYNYKSVYGKFPDKIGIHHSQLGLLRREAIFFPIMPQISIAEMEDIGNIEIERHRATFETVRGEDIHPDEVYLPIPGNPLKCVSGKSVAIMARDLLRAKR